MAGPSKPCQDLSDQIVLKAAHDETGWRVVLHLHQDGKCVTLEGHARFTDEQTCHAHGKILQNAINLSLGIVPPGQVQRPGVN